MNRLTSVEAPDPKVIWRACQCVHHARCSQCGWPITDDDARRDHHGLCAMCDTDDLMRGRPPEDRHELSALLAALGLSPDTSVTFQFLRGAELDGDWGDYRVEWAMIPDVAWRYAATNHVATHPWRIHLSGWDAPRIILRWRQWRIGESAFWERTWLRNAPRWTYRRQVRAVDGFPLAAPSMNSKSCWASATTRGVRWKICASGLRRNCARRLPLHGRTDKSRCRRQWQADWAFH